MRIGIFHGIDTPPDFHYKDLAEEAIGIEGIEVVELRWPSRGSIMGDIWGLMTSKEYRKQCRSAATASLVGMNPVERVDLIIGHSMGNAMMIEAVKRLGLNIPMISIGNPLGHPIFGRALRSVNMGKVDQEWPIIPNFWNSDDMVSSWHGWQDAPGGFESDRIAVVGSGRDEHPMELYLSHSKIRSAILDVKDCPI